MNLNDAVVKFEALFSRVATVWEMHDADFVECMSGGIKAEGGKTPCWCADEDTAVRLWFDAACQYACVAAARGKTLLWRYRPEVTWFEFQAPTWAPGQLEPVKLYKVYSVFALGPARHG